MPERLTTVPGSQTTGSGAGQLAFPAGIASDPALPGHVYVLDAGNRRISEFTAWGEFVKAFGWGVNAASPEEELQICTIETGCQAGSAGAGAGQLDSPQAIAVDSAGDIYVAEASNHRVQKFGPDGEFVLMLGYDVVAHGPGDSTNDEQQQLSIAASTGTFKLKFENPIVGGGAQETAALPYDATAAQVEAALNALSTIGGLGGSVAVSGGPGDATGSSPYEITFQGNLGGDDVPELQVDRSSLGAASIGGTLHCSTPVEAKSIEYAWLRNGVPIAGAESPAYTTTVADEGKSIQCQVTAKSTSAVVHVANPVYVAPPEGGTPPPVAPVITGGFGLDQVTAARNEPFSTLPIGSPGGQKLTCTPGTKWVGADSFSYQWYRNGAQIPDATSTTYVVTEADLASPAIFQCAVTASNAGTATTTQFSLHSIGGDRPITEPDSGNPPGDQHGYFEVRMDPPSNVSTSQQGGAPEVCESADTCKAGVRGPAEGQLRAEHYGGTLATDPIDGQVFVADRPNVSTGQATRIQVFDPDGAFSEAIALPSEPQKGFVGIATDDAGKLYAGFASEAQSEVRKLEPNGPTAKFLSPTFVVPSSDGFGLSSFALDASGKLYAVAIGKPQSQDTGSRVLEFNASGACLNCGTFGEGGMPGFDRSPPNDSPIQAIDLGDACGPTNSYIAHGGGGTSHSYFNVYGPPPDPSLCPQPQVAPLIVDQYAVQVDSASAELRARINPGFWNDTTYYVEYGTSPCNQGGCQARPVAPGQRLTTKTTNDTLTGAAIFLDGLSPATTYHYRFVAQSGGGGPIWGVDPDGPDEATFEKGLERSFTTPRPEAIEPCPLNEAFRKSLSALLPDCRAYELVTPLDKEGGDVYSLQDVARALSQASLDGERFVFGSYRAFGDAVAAPIVAQYLAARKADGWRSHYLLGPRERLNVSITAGLNNELLALSPDLCQAWTRTMAEPPLAPAAIPGQINLYRRLDQECGGDGGFEALSTAVPPDGENGILRTEAASADGSASIYMAGDNLTADAPDLSGESEKLGLALYYQVEGEGPPKYVCYGTDGKPIATGCAAGTHGGVGNRNRNSNLTGAISADGERVFWSAPVTVFEGKGKIYLRERPGQQQSTLDPEGKCKQPTRACTVAVSAKGEELSGDSSSQFWAAAKDGSSALFTTDTGNPDIPGDLYRFDVATRSTTLVAERVVGVMGASEDASRVYFASPEVLTPQPNSEGDLPQPGRQNLYLEEGGSFRFLATLAGNKTSGDANLPIDPDPQRRSSRVSADGLHAAFISRAPLTGYDNTDAASGEADIEVFLYDASANGGQGELICASCNPSGARPRGAEVALNRESQIWTAAWLPAWSTNLHPGHFLADDGSRLFFQAADALVPRDSNGAIDVYQWEAPGAGGCDASDSAYSVVNEGCVSVISSGQSPDDAELLDASASGNDVFFTTGASLLEEDYGLVDVYDARVNGGLPSPPKPPAGCEGEACQAPAQAPNDPTPASSSLRGAGNVVEGGPAKPRCRKPKVRRSGRCVKRRASKRAQRRSKAERRASR